jgi:transposase
MDSWRVKSTRTQGGKFTIEERDEIYERIEYYLRRGDKSQAEIARAVGVNERTITRFKQRGGRPDETRGGYTGVNAYLRVEDVARIRHMAEGDPRWQRLITYLGDRDRARTYINAAEIAMITEMAETDAFWERLVAQIQRRLEYVNDYFDVQAS